MAELTLFKEKTYHKSTPKTLIVNKNKFIEILKSLSNGNSLPDIKKELLFLKNLFLNYTSDNLGLLNIDKNGDTIHFNQEFLLKELEQIIEAQTKERAVYYLNRLIKGITEIKTGKINDINLNRWKEYTEIITDSLWILDKRDNSGAHLGWYWGNFVPQIPRQLMLRYTKKGDWVLDPFVGSGTTLIECRKLGRNGIGIELQKDVIEKAETLIQKEVMEKAEKLIQREENKFNVTTKMFQGDSRNINLKNILKQVGINKVQLLIMHPPYYDIIKFSNNPNDLSNAKSIDDFLKMFGEVVDNTYPILENNRYFGLVIGDKYHKGEWIPLGFYCMQEVLKRGYQLKSIIVKNFEETRGKRNQKELWRYRALVGGFYIFKHEYIFLFKK